MQPTNKATDRTRNIRSVLLLIASGFIEIPTTIDNDLSVNLSSFLQNYSPIRLVFEMTHACEYHSDSIFVSNFNRFFVFDRSTWLNNRFDACFGC